MIEDRPEHASDTADETTAGFDFEPAASAAPPEAYRVLARKYRPASFDDLIGQEAMVKTLSNAFELDRIHQAYILTGVRGVGKTTTARILARAFNYEMAAAEGQLAVTRPTIHMPTHGLHCQAIIESRHVDVIEMDAASHTGIDDVRQIIESARYRPVMARTKVYIIDEVHMLSKQAFNGLLKTLEEPPDHVKFLFATTEIDRVPVTVRSRCQRFDLRRVEVSTLTTHLAKICAAEGVAVDEAALGVVARAAEGSVRDALSLLDQAIAHGSTSGAGVSAVALRAMLGIADRTRLIDLFELVMRGEIGAALENLAELHEAGADPGQILVELAELVHIVTRLKLVPSAAKDPALTEEERRRAGGFAERLSIAVLTRAWQLLSKGVQEVKESPRPLAAADMVLVRLAYAADLPTPDEALRKLTAVGGAAPNTMGSAPPAPRAAPPSAVSSAPAAPRLIQQTQSRPAPVPSRPVLQERATVALASFTDVVALAAEKRDIQLKTTLERDVRLVRFEAGRIEYEPSPGASPTLAQTLARKLQDWTGARWMVALSREKGAPSLKEVADAKAREEREGIEAHPLVRQVLERFPGASIVAVRRPEVESEPVAVPARVIEAAESTDEVSYAEEIITEDDL